MKLLKFYASWCGPCKGLSMVINGEVGPHQTGNILIKLKK